MLDEISDNEECSEIDLVVIPPDVDALSDEDESGTSDVLGMANTNDTPGTVEIHTGSILEVDERLPCTGRKQRKDFTSVTPNWKKKQSTNSKMDNRNSDHTANFESLKTVCDNKSCTELFELFFSDKLFEHILKETARYAAESKNESSFTLSKEELKSFLGILLLSGYHKVPSERHYWSTEEDLGVDIVKNALSRNRYLQIKSMLHFTDNSLAQQKRLDKGFIVRQLFDIVQKNFNQFGLFESNLSIDEMIVRYYGHPSLKQFIRGKPIRFGYKLWAACGSSGYCYNFDLYCGKNLEEKKRMFPWDPK